MIKKFLVILFIILSVSVKFTFSQTDCSSTVIAAYGSTESNNCISTIIELLKDKNCLLSNFTINNFNDSTQMSTIFNALNSFRKTNSLESSKINVLDQKTLDSLKDSNSKSCTVDTPTPPTPTNTPTTPTSQNNGDVYSRNYTSVSSFDGSEQNTEFSNTTTAGVGTVFNTLLTMMAVAIVVLVIFRILQGALMKGTFDNIYDQMKGKKLIQNAGTALLIFIFAYAILSFINPDLTGWTLATNYVGSVRDRETFVNKGMCTGNTLSNITIQELIKQNEGFVACPYKDSEGIPTIGVGYNLTNSSTRDDLKNAGVTNIDAIMSYPAAGTTCPANAPKITEEQALKLLQNYLPKAKAAAIEFAGGEAEFNSHPEDMQKILIDMSYNMGSIRFPKMQTALKNHDYVNVAKEMVDSKWYRQVGVRAEKLVDVVKNFSCSTGNSDSIAGQDSDICKIQANIKDSDLKVIDDQGHKLLIENADKFLAMKDAAAKDGINLIVTSAYRSDDDQIRVCKSVCSGNKSACPSGPGPRCAAACSLGGGGSNHMRGDAIDIQNGCSNGNVCNFSSPVAQWMKRNGATYGFINDMPKDGVHYSSTGH